MIEGNKHDQGKPRMDLFPPEAMIEVSKVLAFGADKYGDYNWRGGMKWSRLVGACLRHLMAWMMGEDDDPESALPHLAHALCCLAFLIAYEQSTLGEDDRWIK